MADTAAVPAGIRLGYWQNLTNYECELCPWASIDFALAEEHATKAHLAEGGRTVAIDGLTTDRFGNQVQSLVSLAPKNTAPLPEPTPPLAPPVAGPRPTATPAADAPTSPPAGEGA
jgi:hypothetical protein